MRPRCQCGPGALGSSSSAAFSAVSASGRRPCSRRTSLMFDCTGISIVPASSTEISARRPASSKARSRAAVSPASIDSCTLVSNMLTRLLEASQARGLSASVVRQSVSTLANFAVCPRAMTASDATSTTASAEPMAHGTPRSLMARHARTRHHAATGASTALAA